MTLTSDDEERLAKSIGAEMAVSHTLAFILAELYRRDVSAIDRAATRIVQRTAKALENARDTFAQQHGPADLAARVYGEAEAHATERLDHIFLLARRMHGEMSD